MHALLAHAYHLLLLPAHLAARPAWRSLAVCLALAAAARLGLARRASLRGWPAPAAGALPVILAWAVLAPMQGWPPSPVARLAGLGAVALAGALAGGWPGRALCAALAAWWLRGAPLDWPGIAFCLPVMAGLAAGWAAARRLVGGDAGPGVAAGTAALAGSLWLAGAAPHWSHAALAPACAALVLLDMPAAMPLLAALTVSLAMAALVASDRGRSLPVDAACAAPLLVWAAVAHRRRSAPVGPGDFT